MEALVSAADVLEHLQTSQDGLQSDRLAQLRKKSGWNELPKKKRNMFLLFARQFNDVLVYILIGALVLSVAAPLLHGDGFTVEAMVDAIVILAILFINALLGFIQEYKAEEAIAMLQKLTSPHSRVRRDGKESMISSRELLPGDIVILEAGDKISADGRLIDLSHLEINESSLTGESSVVRKQTKPLAHAKAIADRTNMVFAGTLVTGGTAEYVVTAIGTKTEIGKIAKLVSVTELPETPLAARMKQLGLLLGAVVIGLCLLIVGIGALEHLPLIDMVLIGVSLAVSAVPEGLPAVVTVCLAMGVRRMVKKKALVRRLEALETLGSVTVICADKTGTITENRMRVEKAWTQDAGDAEDAEEVTLLALIAGSCNRAKLPDLGDPTEIGLLEYAKERGVERLPIDDEEVPFTSEEKYMQTRHGDKVFLKGAPEKIVRLCDTVDEKTVLDQNATFASQGLRVLAFAETVKGHTRCVGLLALQDPPRETAASSIKLARKAGIRTVMITGDNIDTAQAIAKEVGIRGPAVLGKDLPKMTAAQIAKTAVFARVSPSHKLQILDALRSRGEIVAMSGDGVNDAPALKGAHVGVAMGKNGTEVAREAASIVLADDHYATIVSAIAEGRRIYDNIRKFVLFLLRANFDELLFITTAILLQMPLPYLPLHILWINLMTDALPALALGMEKAEPDIMSRPPRPAGEHLLSGEWGRLMIAGLLGFSVSFVFYVWLLSSGHSIELARTMALTLAINFELFMVHSVRSQKPIHTIGWFSNRWILAATAFPFLLQIVLIYSPLAPFFHVVPLTLQQWLLATGIAATGLVFFEGMKLLNVHRRV